MNVKALKSENTTLKKGTPKSVALLLASEDTAQRLPSMNPEADPHQPPNLLVP